MLLSAASLCRSFRKRPSLQLNGSAAPENRAFAPIPPTGAILLVSVPFRPSISAFDALKQLDSIYLDRAKSKGLDLNQGKREGALDALRPLDRQPE